MLEAVAVKYGSKARVGKLMNVSPETAETAPAVEDYGTPVGTSLLHIVEEYMITPHCLAETVDAVVHEFLLPVEPPEIYALFFERTYYIFKECFGEILVFELPGNTLSFRGVKSKIGAHGRILIFGRIYAIGRMQVEGGAQTAFMNVV